MSMPKEEIIGMVLEMYDARKEAKEYLEFYANPDEDGKLEEYKKIIVEEFYKTYACAFSKQHLLDEKGKRECHLFLKFYKTVVRDNIREQMTHVLADFLQIEMLQTAVA